MLLPITLTGWQATQAGESADVFYQAKYMFMLYCDNSDGKWIIKANFSSDEDVVSPFDGSIDLKTLMNIIAEAGNFYEARLQSDANPMM